MAQGLPLRRRVLARFFDLLYTRLAWAYDLVAWLASAGYWYRWTESALPYIETSPVLEVGCGRGHLLPLVAGQGQDVIGVDASPQMALHAAGATEQPVLQADGRLLPFPAGHFGTLITTFPAPYVLQANTQREFARVVRPGGRWIWVDAPTLRPTPATALSNLISRVAYWDSKTANSKSVIEQDRSGGYWTVETRRVAVGPTAVMVRVAVRTESLVTGQ